MGLFRKTLIGGVILLLIGLGIILLKPELAFLLRDKLNPNYIKVETSDNLERQKVKIEWSSGGDLIVLFEKGKDLRKVYKEYGENEFRIYYDSEFVGKFGQFKYNNWHGHTYKIELRKDSIKEITFDVKVTGPDENKVWKRRENANP